MTDVSAASTDLTRSALVRAGVEVEVDMTVQKDGGVDDTEMQERYDESKGNFSSNRTLVITCRGSFFQCVENLCILTNRPHDHP